MRAFFAAACCACWWIDAVYARNNQFTEPDGELDDFAQNYTVGDTMNIKWLAGWWGSETQPDSVDLFVSWFKSDSYSQLLLANFSVKQAGFYPWTINVTEAAVKADDKFVLRFRPHRDPKDYSINGPMAPSRGFVLKLNPSSSSSSSSAPTSTSPPPTASQPPTSTTSTPSTQTLTPAQQSASADPDHKPTTLIGAIVGGVLGGLVFAVLLAIAIVLFRRKQRKNADTSPHQPPPPPFGTVDGADYYQPPPPTSYPGTSGSGTSGTPLFYQNTYTGGKNGGGDSSPYSSTKYGYAVEASELDGSVPVVELGTEEKGAGWGGKKQKA